MVMDRVSITNERLFSLIDLRDFFGDVMKKNKIEIKKPKKRHTWKISPVTKVKESEKIYKRKGKKKLDLKNEFECDFELLKKDYRYCPKCSAELVEKKIEHKKRKVCPVCGFVLYKNPAPATAIILTQNNKILLVKRKYNPFKGDWSLPAGFIEYDESPESCAIREAKEETNLNVKLTRLFDVYSGSDDPRTNAILIVYLAEVLGGDLKPGDDASEAKYFPENKIPQNIAFAVQRQVIEDFYKSIL